MTKEEQVKEFCELIGFEGSIKLKEMLVSIQNYELAAHARTYQRENERKLIMKDILKRLPTEELKSGFILHIASLQKKSYQSFTDKLTAFLED